MLTPSEKWAEMDAVPHGDLGAILERAGNGRENMKTDIPMPELSVSVVAGAEFENLRPSGHEPDGIVRGRRTGCGVNVSLTDRVRGEPGGQTIP